MTKAVIIYILKCEVFLEDVLVQMIAVGWKSVLIVFLSSFFIGMVLALQIGYASINFFSEPVFVATTLGFSLVMELSPVLTAIIITAKVGATITAELGAMKITEQLDALYTLGTNPIKYLAVSRFLACFFMLPILTVFSNVFGICGGMILSKSMWKITISTYFSEILSSITVKTFFHGFIKSFFFALIVVIISCYKGFNAGNNTKEVGKSTTNSVTYSMITIFIFDYFLTSLLVTLKIK
jgi:phospholipid/cholesterol/gamma-HCH transport system permease protein